MKIENRGDSGQNLEIILEEIPVALLVVPEGEEKISIYFANHYQTNGGGILTMLYGQLRDITLGYFKYYGVSNFEDLKKFIKENPNEFFDIIFTVIFSIIKRLKEFEQQNR